MGQSPTIQSFLETKLASLLATVAVPETRSSRVDSPEATLDDKLLEIDWSELPFISGAADSEEAAVAEPAANGDVHYEVPETKYYLEDSQHNRLSDTVTASTELEAEDCGPTEQTAAQDGKVRYEVPETKYYLENDPDRLNETVTASMDLVDEEDEEQSDDRGAGEHARDADEGAASDLAPADATADLMLLLGVQANKQSTQRRQWS